MLSDSAHLMWPGPCSPDRPENDAITSEAIRSLVDRYTCSIGGTSYKFKVQWMAVEKHRDPAVASHLLRFEVEPARQIAGQSEKILLFAWVTRPAELPSILEDALTNHLSERTPSLSRR